MQWPINITIIRTADLNDLILGVYEMALNMERLTADVERNTSVTQSVLTLVQNMADELRANSGNQAAVDALADKLESSANQLADAVSANTPADNTGGGENPSDTGGTEPTA